jgi:murein DD-endopeptidase MepM/ murein hydrolase activator NlpD
MNLEKYIKKISIVALFALTVSPSFGQDLLARQAPVDRRMRALDTLALRSIEIKENRENPAAQLYEDFNNQYAHHATSLPSHYRIDLRHFCMPTPSRVVTSNFGARWGRQHKGLDIKVYIGDTIRAAFDGKVRVVRYEGRGYGKYIVIRHNNGLETIYGHLSKQLVSENEEVRAGDVIGLGGNTGRSTGSHLHFETRLCGVALNPALFFDFRNQDVTGDFYNFDLANYERESAEATRVRGKIGNGGYTRDMIYGEVGQSANRGSSTSGELLYHKVKPGETLISIAKKRGVSVEQIVRLSNLGKNPQIHVGQILRYS